MTRYHQQSGIVTRQIAGETLLIPVTQVGVDLQKVYLLNETAASVWQAFAEPRTLEEVVAVLAEEYDAQGDELHAEVAELLQEFCARSFVSKEAADE
jgi:hypothetical protein